MDKHHKKHTSRPEHRSSLQLTLAGFETSFERIFNSKNRWVVLAYLIPWGKICNI